MLEKTVPWLPDPSHALVNAIKALTNMGPEGESTPFNSWSRAYCTTSPEMVKEQIGVQSWDGEINQRTTP
jgi:hypothetical protein